MQKLGYVKSELRSHILTLLLEKIDQLEKFIQFTIEASRDIKKTPKYDSVREEAQEEIYQLQKQLSVFFEMQRAMSKVVNTKFQNVHLGSLVITNKARFYISVSLGEFFFEGDRFYAISQESPLAQKMLGMQTGDEFVLNNIHQVIEEIF